MQVCIFRLRFTLFLRNQLVLSMKTNKNNRTNKEIVEITSTLLATNKELWEPIYARYADSVIRNHEKYGKHARCFKVDSPLFVYSSLGKVMSDSNTSLFDLRFAGQSVGMLRVNKENKVKLIVSGKQAQYAKDHFHFESSKELKGVDWKTDKDANSFRLFYYDQKSTEQIAIKSEEHRIESFMLREFSKQTRKQEKKLCNIQPIRLGGKFFQLTTPLAGSSHEPIFSINDKNGATGGGIDILARAKHAPFKSRIAIIELKDENNPNEPQELVMQQALIYATFIAFLLRSCSGDNWWNIFRENFKKRSIVPSHLDLDLVSLMPEGLSKEGDLSTIELEGLNTTLHLYTLYYNKDENGNPKEFSGTLKEALLP